MVGWIKLHRQLLDSEIFANQTALKIWLWLLLKASTKKRFVSLNVGNGFSEIKLEVGELLFGRFKAEEKLNIDGSTIYKWLKKMEQLEMITIISNNKYSIITICNYESYQQQEIPEVAASEQQRNNNVTTSEQQRNTVKELEEYNKKKEEERKNIIYSDFYDYQIIIAKKHVELHSEATDYLNEYIDTIEWLFNVGKFSKVDILQKRIDEKKYQLLKLNKQLSFINFITIKNTCLKENIKYLEVFEDMENWKDLSKKCTDFYKVALTFIKNRKKKLWKI